CTPLKPSLAAQSAIAGRVLNGGLSAANWARKMAGPLIVFTLFDPPYGLPMASLWTAAGSCRRHDPVGQRHRRLPAQGLIDDTVPLCQRQKLGDLIARRIGVEVEAEADRPESDRRLLGDAERPA